MSDEYLTLDEFKKFKTEYNNMVSRLARVDAVDERILELQNAIKDIEKVNSSQSSRANSFSTEIAGLVGMVTQMTAFCKETLEYFKQVSERQPVVVSKTIKDNTTQPTKATEKTEGTTFTPNSYMPSVKGIIETLPQVKEVPTSSGPKQITEFDLKVGDEVAKIALWENTGKEVVFKKIGDKLTLTAMSVKTPYEGKHQLSSTRKTMVK